MWPFNCKSNLTDAQREEATRIELDRAGKMRRYRERLDAVRICNTGDWAAVGLGTVAWGVSAEDAVQRHRGRVAALSPRDPQRPRPLRPHIIPVTGTGQWAAFSRGRYAEGPTPRIAAMRLLEKIKEQP